MAKRPTANIKRLRALRKLSPPTCCLEPMVLTYLHPELLSDEQKAALTEEQEAERVANAWLPPVWVCSKCEREEDIEGIDWPEPDKDAPATEAPTPNKTRAECSYCPHCGKRLPVMA